MKTFSVSTKRTKKHTKRTKKHTKKRTNKHTKKRTKKHTNKKTKKRGGEEKPNSACKDANVACNFLDRQFRNKKNQTWDTCINMNGIYNHIIYITPNNVVIKSIEPIQAPEFVIEISNTELTAKVMIEDKFVSCFLYVCGDWYVIMRLFGKTLNTDYLARTEKNKAFYKLDTDVLSVSLNMDDPNKKGTGLITLSDGKYEPVNKKLLFSTSNAPIYQITSGFTNINKQSIVNGQKVFNVLQRFRQEKILANHKKQELAKDVAKEVF